MSAAVPRLRLCVERWPECSEGLYDPRCCRFPKTCSCDIYDPERVGPDDLEFPVSAERPEPNGELLSAIPLPAGPMPSWYSELGLVESDPSAPEPLREAIAGALSSHDGLRRDRRDLYAEQARLSIELRRLRALAKSAERLDPGADHADRGDLARNVTRLWAANRGVAGAAMEPVGFALAAALDRLAAAYGETP